MILVMVGSSTIPFDRLVQAASTLGDDEETLVQHGSSRAPDGVGAVEYMPFDDMVACIRRARVVVTHGGVGSILVALGEGKRPVVVPRRVSHGEAVDDHQVELARRLAEDGLVVLVDDVRDLQGAIAPLASPGQEYLGTVRPGPLGRVLRTRIDAQLAGTGT